MLNRVKIQHGRVPAGASQAASRAVEKDADGQTADAQLTDNVQWLYEEGREAFKLCIAHIAIATDHHTVKSTTVWAIIVYDMCRQEHKTQTNNTLTTKRSNNSSKKLKENRNRKRAKRHHLQSL